MNATRTLVTLCVVIGLCSSVYGWGEEGHKIVAQLAANMLTDATQSNAQQFLGDKSLPDIAPLPDDYDHTKEGKWSASCHYVDMPTGATQFLMSYCGSCCVVGAIMNYTQILGQEASNPSPCDYSKYDEPCALEFLVHFVGDSHQPLHVGWASDRGGNEVTVSYFGDQCNLHQVWDDKMIQMWNTDYTSASQELQNFIDQNPGVVKQYTVVTSPTRWADESFDYVRDGVYNFTTSNGVGQIGQDYYNTNLPVVKQRLIAAGVRLGTLLNRLLGSNVRMNNKNAYDFIRGVQTAQAVKNAIRLH